MTGLRAPAGWRVLQAAPPSVRQGRAEVPSEPARRKLCSRRGILSLFVCLFVTIRPNTIKPLLKLLFACLLVCLFVCCDIFLYVIRPATVKPLGLHLFVENPPRPKRFTGIKTFHSFPVYSYLVLLGSLAVRVC